MTVLTKKENKNMLKGFKKQIIDQSITEGTYQKKQLPFNDFCNLIEKLTNEIAVESFSEINTSTVDLSKEDIDQDNVDIKSAEWVIANYAEISKTKLKTVLKNTFKNLVKYAEDSRCIDFKTNPSDKTFAGIYAEDHTMVKITNGQLTFFLKFVEKEVCLLDENDIDHLVHTVHVIYPIIGVTK